MALAAPPLARRQQNGARESAASPTATPATPAATAATAATASPNGGGIYDAISGTVRLKNTIVASNTSGLNFAGAGIYKDLGHNLSSDGSGSSFLTATGDLNNTNPLLGKLMNNGGPTQTMALLGGSPAINAGENSGAPATDQRGFNRIVGGTVDIGAFEVQTLGDVSSQIGVVKKTASSHKPGTDIHTARPSP